jgi:hypothetical protein
VAGMNWAIPWAPAGETASGSKFDSAASCAARSPAETLQRAAARSIGARNGPGTNAGNPSEAARPSAARPPTELASAAHGAGPRTYPKCYGVAFNLLASIAQHELEERREAFDRARRSAVERGIWQRRQTRRGYRRSASTRRLVPDRHAESVRTAARDFLVGATISELARRLRMTPSGMRQLLRNLVYLGELRSANT